MRFLINVIESIDRPAHSRQEIDAIDAFNDEMVAAGQRVLAVGITSPENSIQIDNRDGQVKYIKESLADSNEYVSGIWIIDVPNREIALELAAQGSKACNRRVELRPLLG
ncbi:MAG: hypothetical protein ABR64_00565 [Actinobacteria bacterium BACL2 MAG-121001-bin67]|uniref:Uncharacterized protein n=2 Tax=ac1 cluster TaxID=1655545 RepID=A0A0R2P4T8_9ACTN|nr:MAG: hypothetical protein ABR64_00565 [Actinobacteria bacterium BACL2 MAG-121001-bin67]KRO33390.1 MAG: hypothetical protein ABR65_02955 [Actinobacteria bacterium BACL2 MAG-121220-bin52]KRP30938.1 MAG: hypothetical protein ABS31_02410 [Actinobacteria bacterium BACL2 MAG-120507-bin38]